MAVEVRQRIALAVVRAFSTSGKIRREILLTRKKGEQFYGFPTMEMDWNPNQILRSFAHELWSKLGLGGGVISPSPFMIRVEGRDSNNNIVEDTIFVGSFYSDVSDRKPSDPEIEWVWATHGEADEDIPLTMIASKVIKKLREEMML